MDKLIVRERKIQSKKRDAEILAELRKPQEDSEIANQKEFPILQRLPGLKLTGQALADLLMVFEFLHNFGETLGFGEYFRSKGLGWILFNKKKIIVLDMDSLPTLQSLHLALCSDGSFTEAEEELLSVMTHLLVCAIEDPGIPNPVRHTTLLGQTLRTADITNGNVSEVLRIYLYAVATGEVRQISGIVLDRERERRCADHHSTDAEHAAAATTGKNSQYYALLHENVTWKLAECLKENPFVSLNPTVKAQMLAHLCNDLLLNKAVVKQIEGSLEAMAQYKREKYLLENRIRKYKHLHTRKIRMEQFEKQQLLAKQSESIPRDGFAEPRQNDPILINENNNEAPADKLTEQTTTGVSGGSTTTTTTTTTAATTAMTTPVSGQSFTKTTSNLTNASSIDNLTDVSDLANHKDDSIHSADVVLNKNLDESPIKEDPTATDKANKTVDDFSIITEVSRSLNNGTSTPDMNSLLNKKIHARSGVATTTADLTDISVHDVDDDISDLESEGTTLEEDEDNRMTADEIHKKLEKIIKSGLQNKQLLEQSCNQLRATCHGQDRYWRRYWYLPKTGGIFVEGLESAQPEILKYHGINDEANAAAAAAAAIAAAAALTSGNGSQPADLLSEKKRRGRKRKHPSSNNGQDDAASQSDEQPKGVGNEQSWQDAHEIMGSVGSGPEDDDGMMDIEDSIPTAILVQKANQNAGTIVEVNNQIGGVNVNAPQMVGQNINPQLLSPKQMAQAPSASVTPPKQPEPTIPLTQDPPVTLSPAKTVDTTMEEDVTTVSDKTAPNTTDVDVKPKLENGEVKEEPIDVDAEKSQPNDQAVQQVDKSITKIEDTTTITIEDDTVAPVPIVKDEIKEEIKQEIKDEIITIDDVKPEPIFDKWFSIANRELPLTSLESDTPMVSQIAYSNLTCDMMLQFQGNRWDIGNNAHYFNMPIENTYANLHFNRDSFLSPSGLDEEMMKRALMAASKKPEDSDKPTKSDETEDDDDEPMPSEEIERVELKKFEKIEIKHDFMEQLQPFQLPSFLNMSIGNISAYIQCDNPSPLQMTPDEQKLLDEVKANGLPKRLEQNLVPKELRYGWWKIDDIETLNEIIQCLHVRGVRERDLRQNLLNALSENMDLTTQCHVGNTRAPPPPKGYIDPEPMNAWNPEIARRVELNLLDQVEALEDKIASASMQIKGWAVPSKDNEAENGLDLCSGIELIKERILGLEAAIERRYLKPPLGTR